MAESDRDRLRRQIDEILRDAEALLEGAARETVRRLLVEADRLASSWDFANDADWSRFERALDAEWSRLVDEFAVAEIRAILEAGAIGAGMSRPFPPEFRAAAARHVRTQRNRIVVGREVDGLTLSRQVSERFRDVVESGLRQGLSSRQIAIELDIAFQWDGSRGAARRRLTRALSLYDDRLDDALRSLNLPNRNAYDALPGVQDPRIDRLIEQRDRAARLLAENRAESSLFVGEDGQRRWGRLEVERPDGVVVTRRADLLDKDIAEYARANGITKRQAADKFRVQRRVTHGWEARANRIARTEATTAYNGGAYEASVQREREGRPGSRQWLATIDARTRRSHWQADGQCRDGTSPFSLGGQTARFPGDQNLSADERINCRCALLEFDGPGCSAAEDREFKRALERSDATRAEIARRRADGQEWGRDTEG